MKKYSLYLNIGLILIMPGILLAHNSYSNSSAMKSYYKEKNGTTLIINTAEIETNYLNSEKSGILSYKISGIGPGKQEFTMKTYSTRSYLLGLEQGKWQITVEAENKSNILIGRKSLILNLKSSVPVEAHINLNDEKH